MTLPLLFPHRPNVESFARFYSPQGNKWALLDWRMLAGANVFLAVTTYKGLDGWLSSIMTTWKFI